MDSASTIHEYGVPVYVDVRQNAVLIYVPRTQMSDVVAGELVELILSAAGGVYRVEGRVDAATRNVVRIRLSRLYRQFFQSMLEKHPFALISYRRAGI